MIAKISQLNGNKIIEIDGKPYVPVAYRSFRPIPSNISQFYRSGVRLFQIQVSGKINAMGVNYSNYGGVWKGENEYDFAPFDKQMAMMKKFAPEGKIMVMILLDTPDFWLESHPNQIDSYKRVGEAVFYDDWIECADKYIKNFIKYAEEKYGDDIFAYSYAAGLATEWFDEIEYYTPSEKKKKAFFEYSNGMSVPEKDELFDTEGICMREPDSAAAKYRDFCSSLTPGLIKHFAATFRKYIGHDKIIGIFYGYTDSPDPGFQIQAATSGYEAVWKDPDIDMLFSPAAYSKGDSICRELTGASSYQYLVDSIELNNKLYLHEIDHRTHLAEFPLENGAILDSYPDLFTTREILRREFAAALCKGGSLWWFDLFGSYYACPELEDEISLQCRIAKRLLGATHKSVSEIAVFADAPGFNLLKEKLNLTVDYVRSNRDALHKCGAPFDYFNLSDLTRIDTKKYKLFIFLFAPRISPETRKAIASLGDKMKVFIHLPDIASSGKLEPKCVCNLINMNLETENEEEKAFYKGVEFGFHTHAEPIFKITDENAVPLALYKNGDVCCAQKDTVIYSGVGCISPALWHDIARRAGVHCYTEKEIPVYADSRFVACQFPDAGTDTLMLDSDGDFTEVFSGKVYRSHNKVLEFEHYAHQMMMFVKNN